MAANNAPCTQGAPRAEDDERGCDGLVDAHFELFMKFFRGTNYNPKVLVQHLRVTNGPELAAAFADALVLALLDDKTLLPSGESADAQRDIAEEFGFLTKLSAAMSFNQASVEHLPMWYSESWAKFVVRVVVRLGMMPRDSNYMKAMGPELFGFPSDAAASGGEAWKDCYNQYRLYKIREHKQLVQRCLRAFLPFVAKLHPMLPYLELKHSTEGVFGLMVALRYTSLYKFDKMLEEYDDCESGELLYETLGEVVAEAICASPCQDPSDWRQPFGYSIGDPEILMLLRRAEKYIKREPSYDFEVDIRPKPQPDERMWMDEFYARLDRALGCAD